MGMFNNYFSRLQYRGSFTFNKSKQLVVEKDERAYLVFNNKDYEINHIVTVKYTDIVSLQNNNLINTYTYETSITFSFLCAH